MDFSAWLKSFKAKPEDDKKEEKKSPWMGVGEEKPGPEVFGMNAKHVADVMARSKAKKAPK